MAIKNIVFDVGNVLVNWAPHEVVNQHFSGHPAADRLSHQIFKSPQWLALNRGECTEMEAIQAYSQQLGIPLEQMERLMAAVKASLVPLPDSIQLLEKLYFAGTPLYAITDNVHEYMAHMRENYTFLDKFQGIVVSAEVGILKPDAAIYRYLLDIHGLKAEETVFIDDHFPNVEGARKIGMAAIHFVDAASCTISLAKLGVVV